MTTDATRQKNEFLLQGHWDRLQASSEAGLYDCTYFDILKNPTQSQTTHHKWFDCVYPDPFAVDVEIALPQPGCGAVLHQRACSGGEPELDIVRELAIPKPKTPKPKH